MSIINLIIFLSILLFVIFSSSYLAGLILIFALSILEIAEYGMTHFLFLLVCELTIALFIVREIKFKKDNSPLLKYNPLHKNNLLPRKVQIIFCIVFLVALVVRFASLFSARQQDCCGELKGEYQRSANAFINKIVIAHKKGEDYHSIIQKNPFTNDVFLCKVVSLLDAEYSRIDAMKHSIVKIIQSDSEIRNEELGRLSEECLKESSNVVNRIMSAEIGELNASKMAKDFSNKYISLQKRCSENIAVENNGN